MDVIWVPDSGSSTSTDASVGVVGMQTFGNLALCVVGLLILVSGAVGRYLLADLHVNAYSDPISPPVMMETVHL